MRSIALKYLPPERRDLMAGTWRQARPRRIATALEHALGRDPGGWFVAGASSDVPASRTITRTINGVELVFWRDEDGSLLAGPGACPHLGALLTDCEVMGGQVYCRWHGMELGASTGRSWLTYPAYDDGVLVWVRLPVPGETPSERPVLAARPEAGTALTAVIARAATCETRDIIANRLDPWHGAWFHPYAFSHLTVDESATTEARLVLDVSFRVSRSLAVPVRADFTCPDARTIVMTILDGEGVGSVVETHATPLGTDQLGRPVTIMTEATIATSPRPGFGMARRVAPLIEAAMRRTAGRLWVDDLVYAERLWTMRTRDRSMGAPGGGSPDITPDVRPDATSDHRSGTDARRGSGSVPARH